MIDITTTPSFQLGRFGEIHVKKLLEEKGAVILDADSYSKLGAPKLNSTILPDLFEFRCALFVEVKTKCDASFFRKTQQWMYGVGIRKHENYERIAKMTGKDVWITFFDLDKNRISCALVGDTPIHHTFNDSSRIIKGVDNGGMVFYAVDDLYPFSTLLGKLEAS